MSANGKVKLSLLEAVLDMYKKVVDLTASQTDRCIVIIGNEEQETTVGDQLDRYIDLSRSTMEQILKDIAPDDDTQASSPALATINTEGYNFGGPQDTTEETGEK